MHQFYNQRRQQLLSDEIKSNPAHTAIAKFEHDFSESFLLITQNIDNLHERDGSQNTLHMHGELLKMHCQNLKLVFDICEDLKFDSCCRSEGNFRPNIVWFGEIPFHRNKINQALEACELFIAIGTSGNVYPASGFYQTAKVRKAHTTNLNLKETNSSFDEHIYGLTSEAFPTYPADLLGQ